MKEKSSYVSLYVPEPFSQNKYFSNSSKDYCYYLLLRKWFCYNSNLSFIDIHNGNYNVRELASWDDVIKPRIHSRLDRANTFVLILSSNTRESWAINEEIEYGINFLKLPVKVIYPECNSIKQLYDEETGAYSDFVIKLWNRLPKFKAIIESPIVDIKHLPFNRSVLKDYFN